MKVALFASAALIWLVALPPLVDRLLRRLGMVRPNFQGDSIPVGFGLAILLWTSPALLAAARLVPERRPEYLGVLALAAAFGLLGFVDDRWGDRSVGGLRGHLRKFFVDGEITTGFVKMAGGSLVAFVVPWRMWHHAWSDALLEGALIALCANAFNLLDLRPGRAGALFLLGAVPLAWATWEPGGPPALLFVLVPAIIVYERDARARAMLGDTGSNLLGATLGATLVLAFPGIPVKAALVGLLVALHLAAERWSLTKVIESVPILRALDRLTGKR